MGNITKIHIAGIKIKIKSPPGPGLLPVPDYRILVFQGPADKRVDVRDEGAGAGCQGVFHARRDLGVDRAGHISVFLQGPQGHGQHLLGDVRDFALEFLETHGSLVRLVYGKYDQQGPFVADPCKYISYRAAREKGVHNSCPVHNILFSRKLDKSK